MGHQDEKPVQRLNEQSRWDEARDKVLEWNTSVRHDTLVIYEKSPVEGSVTLRTRGCAYAHNAEAVVDLEHIGPALLSKIKLIES
jgi:hypothetical protein